MWRNFAILAKNLVFGQFSDRLFITWQTFLPTLIFLCYVVIAVNGKILNSIMAIWSHCCLGRLENNYVDRCRRRHWFLIVSRQLNGLE